MRRRYSLEFKQKVIIQALEAETVATVARKFQLNSLTIYKWVREYKQGKHKMVHINE